MLDTLPLTLRYIDKRLADGFVVDSAVFFVLIVVTVALYVVVQNWGPTRILFHASLLASAALCFSSMHCPSTSSSRFALCWRIYASSLALDATSKHTSQWLRSM